MSFRAEEEPELVDYFEAMKRACLATKLPIELVRIDLVEGDYEISQKIMDEIDEADIVLADFTLSPANVYFELGYARGCKRRIIQTARRGAKLEFDARNWRTIFYRNATELEESLKSALNDAYAETVKTSE
jgi:nucleoside 2-deoxyribosyltransferase